MRKLLFSVTTLAIVMGMCPVMAGAAEPDEAQGSKTYKLPSFTFAVPGEFNKGSDWQCYETHYRFDSEAINLWDDGSEYGSSCTIDIDGTDASSIYDIQDFAVRLKIMHENMDEVCDDPVVEGNTILMRTLEPLQDDDGNDDGYNVYWRFAVFGGDQRMAIGVVSFRDKEEKYYNDVAKGIVQSINFK